MDAGKKELLNQVWNAQDDACKLICEYRSLSHYYGEYVLYQAEGQIIDFIAIHPGTTITELAELLEKTPSACSQIVRKLRAKGWVSQSRNEENNRIWNLTLTESGMNIYRDHLEFTQSCQDIAFQMLSEFTTEELESHLLVQRRLIEAYKGDVKRSRERLCRPALAGEGGGCCGEAPSGGGEAGEGDGGPLP